MMTRNPSQELDQAPFSRGQKAIIDALSSIYPRRIYIDDLVDNVYQLDPNGGPDNAHQTVRTQICNIRKRLPQYGWTIPTTRKQQGQHGWYRLEPVANDNNRLERAAA